MIFSVDFYYSMLIQIRSVSPLISRLLLTIVLLVSFTTAGAADHETTANNSDVLQIFVSESCPHCAKVKLYMPEFSRQHPWLTVEYRSLEADPAAREDLVRYSQAAGVWPPGVPTFVFRDRVLVGFDDARSTGPLLEALLERSITRSGDIDTGLFGTISVSRVGLPLFTLAIGLLDGFNPCAMWVLLFLLSMLVHLQDRKRMAIIAGTFVLVSGLVYYIFMAAWLNLFLILDMSSSIRIILAGIALFIGVINVKDFLAVAPGITLSIPDSAKPGIYARVRRVIQAEPLSSSLIAVAILAVLVNLVELLCTAGFPAIYTAILTRQGLEPVTHYAYLGLYIAGYITDDALMVGTAVMALSNRRLTERGGRLLKLISGAAMLLLGIVMLVKPEWLF